MQMAHRTKPAAARVAFTAFAVLLSPACHEASQGAPPPETSSHPDYGAPFAKPSSLVPPPAESGPRSGGKLIVGTGKGCPSGMARVDGFCIDRFESYLVNLSTKKPHPHEIRPNDIHRFMAKSEPGVFPQGYLSQIEADIACRNARKRLCSRSEWLEACMGPKREAYVYGTDLDQGRCGDNKRPHVMSLYFGPNDPSKYWTGTEFNDPIINSTPGYLDRTGSYPGCQRNGVYDLEGELHEWNSDVGANGMGTFSGSCYSDNDIGCGYYAQTHARAYHDYSTGFRCCADAKK